MALPGVRELASRTSRALLLQQVTYRELWDVAVELESLAARLAAQRRSEADIVQLAGILDDARTNLGDRGHTAGLDVAFHAGVAAASKNRVLISARGPVNLQAHEQVLAAIRAGDAAGAEHWTNKHLTDFRRGFEQAGIAMDQTVPGHASVLR